MIFLDIRAMCASHRIFLKEKIQNIPPEYPVYHNGRFNAGSHRWHTFNRFPLRSVQMLSALSRHDESTPIIRWRFARHLHHDQNLSHLASDIILLLLIFFSFFTRILLHDLQAFSPVHPFETENGVHGAVGVGVSIGRMFAHFGHELIFCLHGTGGGNSAGIWEY